MRRQVITRMTMCPVIIMGTAVVIPLLVRATPWPIPVDVHHEALFHPWRDASESERIYVARVQDICGIVNRVADFDVLEIIKGDVDPKFESPLGTIAGSRDMDKVFIVLEDSYGWLVAAFAVRVQNAPSAVPAPGLDAPGIARFSGEELVDVIRDCVRVQSADEHLTEADLETIERYITGDRSHWYWLMADDMASFLSERRDGAEATRLLRLLEDS